MAVEEDLRLDEINPVVRDLALMTGIVKLEENKYTLQDGWFENPS